MARSVFITGAGSGIGRAAARRFSRGGWLVGAFDIDPEGLAETCRELPSERTVQGPLDVTDPEAWRRALETFSQVTGGRLDVLLNNAGVLHFGPFESLDRARAARMIDINARGVVEGIYAALPLLEKTPGAAVLNMASGSALYGPPDMAVYAATKFFVRGLTEALDLELAPKGIRVCAIFPGFVATPMVAQQTFTPGSMKTLGVHLQAEHVASLLWRVAHARRRASPHWYLPAYQGVLARAAGAFPGLSRWLMKRIARR
ncbi:MAG: SDR family oxidoreductase [Deltaproteobacteria bacterium]|nr:SDR family oxidoreductase [Deltaproteobacteria bacterium]